MAQEKAGSHRDAAEDHADGGEAESPRRATGERTTRVLEDADGIVDLIDEVIFGEIKDEKERDEYARATVAGFKQKGGQ